ncbi:TIM barrel protein [Paenibacillus agricola]|uniref:TIM barrel protein n=1 Tax=Paenibacillus agricola TaxID=2716264 RepID=UPI0028930DB0|nr:TIM barrel protein [Paenibacillus agricola]
MSSDGDLFVVFTKEVTKQFVDQMESDHLQIIFDPSNLLNPENYLDQDYIISEFFDLLGDKIVAVHAKDFIIENGKKRKVSLGQGIINHSLVYSRLKEVKPASNVLIDPSKINETLEFLRKILNTV